MVEGAICPNCTKPVSNTSIRANAPICTGCGVTLTIIDGKLGFIGPYRVLDRGTSRKLAEANLAVFREQLRSYRGMQGDCKQRLKWSVEEYAEFHKMLPQQPELLAVEDVPSFWKGLVGGIREAWIMLILSVITITIIIRGLSNGEISGGLMNMHLPAHPVVVSFLIAAFLTYSGFGVQGFWTSGLSDHFRVKAANGNRPLENALRKRGYEKEMAVAFKEAESAKETTDYQLGDQIRELEGYIRTAEKHEAEVLQYLAILR